MATLLGTGVLAALTVDPDSAAQQVTAAAPPATVAELPPVEDTTTTTTAPPPPTTVAAAIATPKPRTATTSAPSRRSSSYPGGVSFPFQTGRTSWSATSNGIDMSIAVDKATPKSGEPVTFTFTLSHATNNCCEYGLTYGDGGPLSVNQSQCPTPPAPGRTKTYTTTRLYNKAGRWQFTLTGRISDCIHDPGAQPLNGYLYGWMEVAPGPPPTSQGPSLPSFYNRVSRYGPTQYDNDPSYVTVHAQTTDVDGYIFKLVVDYGDGSTQTYPETEMGCRQSESGWPKQSFMQTPNNPPPTHQYAAPGTYKVTVTAYSQGCDGRDVQSANDSFEHVYPA